MIGAVREQHGAADERAEPFDDPLDALGRVVRGDESREVVVVRQHLAGDDFGVGGPPAEDDAELIELVAEPAGEEERLDPEACEHLRQLRRVAETVGVIARRGRLDAEAPADAPPEQQVAYERLSADQDLVG